MKDVLDIYETKSQFVRSFSLFSLLFNKELHFCKQKQ